MQFEGKAVLITGASSGIGAAAARRFVAQGARVLAVGRNEERLTALRDELGGNLVSHVADVGVQEEAEAAVNAAVERFGGLDVLVNNAAIAALGAASDTSPETWRRVMAVDLDAVFWACRVALPHLIARKGSIVNTGSISGSSADFGLTAYCVAKAGVHALTRCMAIDYAAQGVRVNCIAPGVSATPMNASLPQVMVDAYNANVPMHRHGTSEDMADAILFLASNRASYITGQVLTVDGGISAHTGQPNVPSLLASLRK